MNRENSTWAAVYGAYLAVQVMDSMQRGEGPPDNDDEWDRIVEEALAVADEATKALERVGDDG